MFPEKYSGSNRTDDLVLPFEYKQVLANIIRRATNEEMCLAVHQSHKSNGEITKFQEIIFTILKNSVEMLPLKKEESIRKNYPTMVLGTRRTDDRYFIDGEAQYFNLTLHIRQYLISLFKKKILILIDSNHPFKDIFSYKIRTLSATNRISIFITDDIMLYRIFNDKNTPKTTNKIKDEIQQFEVDIKEKRKLISTIRLEEKDLNSESTKELQKEVFSLREQQQALLIDFYLSQDNFVNTFFSNSRKRKLSMEVSVDLSDEETSDNDRSMYPE